MEENKELMVKMSPLSKLMESPEDAVKLLDSVKRNFGGLLKKNGEIISIPTRQGKKEYVRYEGWVTIATVMGIMPRITELIKIDKGYQARAEAVVVKTGAIVGSAYGICSKDEPTWAQRPDFSLAAMAQTRAAARALKTILSGVITHIGYEGTPAEILEEAEPAEAPIEAPRASAPQTNGNSGALATENQKKCIFAISKKLSMSEDEVKAMIKDACGKESVKELTMAEASSLIDRLQK